MFRKVAGAITAKAKLFLVPLTVFCALSVSAKNDPLVSWQSNIVINEVAPMDGRHSIHSYFNVCPESPDGKWVLFFVSKMANAQCGDVCIRDRITGEEKILARDIETEDAHRVACQQWVSGGRRVVYHGEREGCWFVAVVDVDTGRERILARDRLSGWSQPCADFVPLYGLHWSPGENRDLELVNVITGEIEKVLTVAEVQSAYSEWIAKIFNGRPVSIFFPVMSPDLQRVFFKMAAAAGGDARSKNASKREGLVCYNLADKKLLFSSPRWGHPSWCPDSCAIIEAGNALIDSKNGQTRRIPGLPGFGSGHPSASPDGKLFVTDTIMDRVGGSKDKWGIVVADMTGTNLVVVHQFDNSHGASSWRRSHPHPVFSADGQRIYFNVNSGKWTQLYAAEKKK